MIVDDRLETVLRTVAAGPGAVATQTRQLLDILGRTPADRWTDAHAAALTRLDSLIAVLGETPSASLISSSNLRSPILVEHFAEGGPKVALAAITAARLSEPEWMAIIPELPVQARGFLRHRRDLGEGVDALLARLGITDFALPLPAGFEPSVLPHAEIVNLAQAVPRTPAPSDAAAAGEGIGAIIARIEAFRRARDTPGTAASESIAPAEGIEQSRLPFADEPPPPPPRITAVDLMIDAEGTVTSADTELAPALIGLRPFAADPDAPLACDPGTLGAARTRLPVIGGRIELEWPEAAAGPWRIDAVPRFATDTGHFLGWNARLRRLPVLAAAEVTTANDDDAARSRDRLRQMLHELRTPINAIQGFAELIQQQMMGPTPHQYRSLAAGIASDAARMLAGFEDVERLALLEAAPAASGPPAADAEADLTVLLTRLIAQLDPLLTPREAVLLHDLPDGPLPIAMPPEELERTLWRLLSLIASAATPGERMMLSLRVGAGANGYAVRLTLPLPAPLATAGETAPTLSDGMAGPGGMLGSAFALRLCAAELRAAGGLMVRKETNVYVTLPLLTAARQTPSQRGVAGEQAG